MAGGSSQPARLARRRFGAPATALLLALLALVVTGCGGDDESGEATTGTARERSDRGAGGDAAGRGGQRPQGGDDRPQKHDSASGESPGSAGFSEQSEPFRTAGGDNSIQTFGAEASESERAAASTVLEDYMAARAAGDWATQCDLLARDAVKPIEELLSRSPELRGKGCAAILAALGSRAGPALRRNTMDGPIDSLRLEGERAFALYHGDDDEDYFVPMALEGGDWKVASIGGPTEFP